MNGMIAAAERALKVTNRGTQIIPGHGPLADRPRSLRIRDLLVTVRDRVQKLKAAGRTEAVVVAAKPTAVLDTRPEAKGSCLRRNRLQHTLTRTNGPGSLKHACTGQSTGLRRRPLTLDTSFPKQCRLRGVFGFASIRRNYECEGCNDQAID